MPSPTISRRPSVLAATAIIAAVTEHDASALAHLQVGRIQPQIGPVAVEGIVFEERLHAFIDFLAQFRDPASSEDAGEPHRLRDLARPRVDTLPIQASWMTATNAFSVVLRASRNGGK